MENIVFLILRRMRAPLLNLIVTFSLAVLGLVLIPGQDDMGNPWHMDFFHAVYFVSYMSTTIGFGEIPYQFTDAQRLWVTLCIFATVVVWIYSIGTILSLVQDKTFRQAVTEWRFARRIRRVADSFYLVCGYGETGSALVSSLTDRGHHVVVVDRDEARVSALRLESLRLYVPALCADAGKPLHLLEAGLKHPLCKGVVALTNSNEINLHVAITSKLLHKELKVICRSDSKDVEANMASFGTDHIINPFETFAQYLAKALQSPGLYLMDEWLSGDSRQQLPEPVYPPTTGLWVLCGYGRFGKEILARLEKEGVETVVVEADPDKTEAPSDTVVGRGTEAATLLQARIDRAVGLVAGTDDDVNNLSIIMTAREINPDLFVILRQNLKTNDAIVEAVEADMVMHPSSIIANRIRVLLSSPLLSEFLSLVQYQDDQWACELISRIIAVVSEEVPIKWEVALEKGNYPAFDNSLDTGNRVLLGDLTKDPRERDRQLACIPLMLMRLKERTLLPDEEISLKRHDRILFCGRRSARSRMELLLHNDNALSYVCRGSSVPQGAVWRLIRRLTDNIKPEQEELDKEH